MTHDDYTTAELARLWKLAPSTIQAWARAGVIEGTKTAHGWLFSPEAVTKAVREVAQPSQHLESRVADVARTRGLATIRELATAAGLHRQTVATWWGRLPRRLYGPTLCLLCKALDTQPGELLKLVDTDE